MSEKPSTRDSIVSLIVENPGIHFREIQRKSGLAVGQLEYHLYQLELEDRVSIREDGNIKRYFSVSSGSYQERQMLFYLRSTIGKEVLQKLCRTDSIPINALLKIRKPIREKRKKLIDEMKNDGIVEIYRHLGLDQVKLKDRTKLIEIARKYRESILESFSDNFISLINEDL